MFFMGFLMGAGLIFLIEMNRDANRNAELSSRLVDLQGSIEVERHRSVKRETATILRDLRIASIRQTNVARAMKSESLMEETDATYDVGITNSGTAVFTRVGRATQLASQADAESIERGEGTRG